ncbi:hypothetical protein [Curtobacterium sp. CFBP9011]|uniref:hypothetical protein n=1 Tax=Curtobacterium sp. CFBP9011 TaxID=3096530 RepID=UPI002A6B7B3D|nr:hypothetical protein [Curtobacterium sp. CFBP9011]MDY1006286.1 hypothetical protein [Curtobacterium sp. CFBP9011]
MSRRKASAVLTIGQLFSVAYRDFDSFSAKSFSLGFYSGTTDKPEPDFVFARR